MSGSVVVAGRMFFFDVWPLALGHRLHTEWGGVAGDPSSLRSPGRQSEIQDDSQQFRNNTSTDESLLRRHQGHGRI